MSMHSCYILLPINENMLLRNVSFNCTVHSNKTLWLFTWKLNIPLFNYFVQTICALLFPQWYLLLGLEMLSQFQFCRWSNCSCTKYRLHIKVHQHTLNVPHSELNLNLCNTKCILRSCLHGFKLSAHHFPWTPPWWSACHMAACSQARRNQSQPTHQ